MSATRERLPRVLAERLEEGADALTLTMFARRNRPMPTFRLPTRAETNFATLFGGRP